MSNVEPLPLNCPECEKPLLVTYQPDPKIKKEAPNRFECPWCHLTAVLYLHGWIFGTVKKRSPKGDGEAGMIRLVMPRLIKAKRTRKRRGTLRKAASPKRRRVR